MLKKYFFTLAFIAWISFVTFSSLYSFEDVHTNSYKIPNIDKLVHFTFYSVACSLGLLSIRERTKGAVLLKKALVVMVISTILFGILMEVLQYALTTHRTGDVLDVLANTLGSLCGAFAMKWLFSLKSGLKWKF